MKAIDLSTLKGAELVTLHNTINSESPVSKFKNTADGVERTLGAIEVGAKGKNKAIFAERVATLPLAMLALLAPAIPVAKDLTTKLFPAQIQVLAKLLEMGAADAHVEKEAFHSAFGIDATDAKLATVLEQLYKNNFLIWEEDDTLMISNVAHKFLEANPEVIDKKTLFADLAFEKVKVQKERKGTGSPRTPDTHLITPLVEENPCNPNKGRFHQHAIWLGKRGKDRITVGDYKAKGGIMFDLKVACILGHAAVQEPTEEELPLSPPKEKKAKKEKAAAPTTEPTPPADAKKGKK